MNLKLLIWLVLIYFPIFLNLGGLCMQKWDEARYGASSYEMLHGENPFVVTYFYQPSLDSAKPPLMHWIQALFIGVFGFSETVVRLPSALAGLAICLSIMYFSLKKFNSFSFGAISTLVLLVTIPEGFCGMDHSIRTADYEGLLAMFSFLALLCFYRFNQQPAQNKYLVLTSMFILLAVLTKAVAGLFFVPGMFVYLLIKRNLRVVLRDKWFYISGAIFILVTGFIFLIREHYSPGYLQALNEMELLGRHNTVKDGHQGEYWYYVAFMHDRFDSFFKYILLGWLFGLAATDRRIRELSLFTLVISVTFLIVLSSAESKLNWYSYPLYPVLAMQGGVFIWQALKFLSDLIARKLPFSRLVLFYLAIVWLFAAPYAWVFENSYNKKMVDTLVSYNNLQLYLKQEREVIRNAVLISTPNDSEGQYLFYFYKCNEDGYNLRYHKKPEAYRAGDKLIIEDPAIQAIIERDYDAMVIDEFTHLKVYEIKGKKTA